MSYHWPSLSTDAERSGTRTNEGQRWNRDGRRMAKFINLVSQLTNCYGRVCAKRGAAVKPVGWPDTQRELRDQP